MPNPEEMVAIGNLTDAQYALVTEDNSTRLGEEELNPACADPLADLNVLPIPGVTPSPNCVQRQKRQADNVLLSMFYKMTIKHASVCMLLLSGCMHVANSTIAIYTHNAPMHAAFMFGLSVYLLVSLYLPCSAGGQRYTDCYRERECL